MFISKRILDQVIVIGMVWNFLFDGFDYLMRLPITKIEKWRQCRHNV
jgi:hypothetical protein